MQKLKTRKPILKINKSSLKSYGLQLKKSTLVRINLGKEGKGIVPLIIQDSGTKQVLSLVWANKESVEKTLKTGYVWRYSRAAGKVVKKGATSGNTQKVISIQPDCDSDALLVVVNQKGEAACHKETWSCFSSATGNYAKMRKWGFLDTLIEIIRDRIAKPAKGSYVSAIIKKPSRICAKLEEEAAELAEAVLKKNDKEVIWEAADLLFFTLVALEIRGIDTAKVIAELESRSKAKK